MRRTASGSGSGLGSFDSCFLTLSSLQWGEQKKHTPRAVHLFSSTWSLMSRSCGELGRFSCLFLFSLASQSHPRRNNSSYFSHVVRDSNLIDNSIDIKYKCTRYRGRRRSEKEQKRKDDFLRLPLTTWTSPPPVNSPLRKTPVDRVSRGQGTRRAGTHLSTVLDLTRSRDRSPSFLRLSFQRLRAIVSWINGTLWTAVYEPSQEYRDPRELFTRNGSNPARKLSV